MSDRTGVVYRVTSPSGKCYIGQTIRGLARRKYLHIRAANTSTHSAYNTKLSQAIRKYGDALVWEVIHDNVPLESLVRLEESEITRHDSFRCGYNSTPSAGKGFLGKNHTEAVKRTLSRQYTGEGNPMFGCSGNNNPFHGKRHSEESRRKMREAARARHQMRTNTNE